MIAGERQEMFNVTLSVTEIEEAIERRILEKYKFLTAQDGNPDWELMEVHFEKANLHELDGSKHGATVFFIRQIPVAEDGATLKEKVCVGDCAKCRAEDLGLKPCR